MRNRNPFVPPGRPPVEVRQSARGDAAVMALNTLLLRSLQNIPRTPSLRTFSECGGGVGSRCDGHRGRDAVQTPARARSVSLPTARHRSAPLLPPPSTIFARADRDLESSNRDGGSSGATEVLEVCVWGGAKGLRRGQGVRRRGRWAGRIQGRPTAHGDMARGYCTTASAPWAHWGALISSGPVAAVGCTPAATAPGGGRGHWPMARAAPSRCRARCMVGGRGGGVSQWSPDGSLITGVHTVRDLGAARPPPQRQHRQRGVCACGTGELGAAQGAGCAAQCQVGRTHPGTCTAHGDMARGGYCTWRGRCNGHRAPHGPTGEL
jgi:hypothetical protein